MIMGENEAPANDQAQAAPAFQEPAHATVQAAVVPPPQPLPPAPAVHIVPATPLLVESAKPQGIKANGSAPEAAVHHDDEAPLEEEMIGEVGETVEVI